MEFVQPIRSKRLIEEIKIELKKQSYRDYLLFCIGINTGLRISDLLILRVMDVKDKTHIEIREKKTNKAKRFFLNAKTRDLLNEYILNMDDKEYLFKSRKNGNSPIDRSQAYRIINMAARKVNIKDKIGTHTLRKTFGYHHYQQNKDVAILQDIFNHSAPSVTLRYIGINDDMKDRSMESFEL